MTTERILVIIGAIGGILGSAWAIDAWVVPRAIPGISLLIGKYPLIGWSSLVLLVGSVSFWIGLRIERRKKPPIIDGQPQPIIPSIPKGARKVEAIVDYPRPGVTRTTVTVDYLDGLPNTPDLHRRNLFQKANNLYKNHEYEEAIPFFYELLSQPYSDAEETALHITIGNSLAYLSKFNEAEDHYEKALEKARKHTDKEGEAAGLVNLAGIYIIKGMLNKALEYSEEALKMNREIGDRSGEARSLDNIGIIYGIKWELNKAMNHIEQALKIYREIGDQEGEIRALTNIGIIYKKADKIDEALEQYQQALKISKKIGDLDAQAGALGNMGVAYKTKGELNKALELYQQSIKISKKIGDRSGEASHLCNIGNVYRIKGELDKALEYCQQALKISRDISDRNAEAATLGNMGIIYATRGDSEKAMEIFQQSLEIFEEMGSQPDIEKTKSFIHSLKNHKK